MSRDSQPDRAQAAGALAAHPLAQAFNRLTPLDVLAAVEVLAPATRRFQILNSYENRVYQLELEDGRWVVGKFYRPGRWSREAIADEHRFLAELAELEIPAIAPLPLGPGGETIGEVQGILFALFPRVGGRPPEEPDELQLRQIGRLIARIHNAGAAGGAPHRPRLTPASFGLAELEFLERSGALPAEVAAGYGAAVRALVERTGPLFEGLPLHRIHGDCHRGNLLQRQDVFSFLDFDDLVVGPAVQDIWLLVPSYDAAEQRAVLLAGYREMRAFEPQWLRLVEPLRGLRYVRYAAWIARRWHDPAFPRTFGHFGTLQYWQRELQDLREQIARIDQERGY